MRRRTIDGKKKNYYKKIDLVHCAMLCPLPQCYTGDNGLGQGGNSLFRSRVRGARHVAREEEESNARVCACVRT